MVVPKHEHVLGAVVDWSEIYVVELQKYVSARTVYCWSVRACYLLSTSS